MASDPFQGNVKALQGAEWKGVGQAPFDALRNPSAIGSACPCQVSALWSAHWGRCWCSS